eukprot:6425209-Amphidinium_carterae.1
MASCLNAVALAGHAEHSHFLLRPDVLQHTRHINGNVRSACVATGISQYTHSQTVEVKTVVTLPK